MSNRRILISLILAVIPISRMPGQAFHPGKNELILRGERQNIFFIPATGDSIRQDCRVIFAPGDGGWHGLAVTIADSIAAWGYDVYGLDTRRYLSSFTGKTGLTEAEVKSDFHQIAQWLKRGDSQMMILTGWSEGAGLGLLAVSANDNKEIFSGLLTIGLPDSNILGWRLIDNLTYLTKTNPNEPMFASSNFLPLVSPLPLYMIQSTADEYVASDIGRQMFNIAREPKKFVLVEAKNHHFGGNREDFYNAMREGLAWIKKMPR